MSGFSMKADLSRFDARVNALVKRWTGSDLEKIGAFADAQVFKDSNQSFRNQADPSTGIPWPPSRRARAAFQSRLYKAEQRAFAGKSFRSPTRTTTLEDSGRLHRAVRSGHEVSATGKVMFWGGTTPLPYAAIHQFGGETGSRRGRFIMPKRSFVGLSSASAGKITDYCRATMTEGA
jgi:phage gpG-like protein